MLHTRYDSNFSFATSDNIEYILKLFFLSSLLILICTKIQLHFAAVCSSGPCIVTEVIGYIGQCERNGNREDCFERGSLSNRPFPWRCSRGCYKSLITAFITRLVPSRSQGFSLFKFPAPPYFKRKKPSWERG